MTDNKPVPVSQQPEILTPEVLGMKEMDVQLFKRAQFYSSATIIPKDYQGNPSNCYIAVEMAHRLDLTPLFVMNGLYIVHGRPAWSSKSLIQLAKSKVLKDLTYVINKDDPKNWKCTAHAITRDDREVTGPEISIELAKAFGWWDKNPIWRNAPELMLRYRSAAWLISTEFPECTGGLLTKEEIEETDGMIQPQRRQVGKTKSLDELVAGAIAETMAEGVALSSRELA